MGCLRPSPLESGQNLHVDTLVALGYYLTMMCGSRNQFSLTRAASSTGRRAKSDFLLVISFISVFVFLCDLPISPKQQVGLIT